MKSQHRNSLLRDVIDDVVVEWSERLGLYVALPIRTSSAVPRSLKGYGADRVQAVKQLESAENSFRLFGSVPINSQRFLASIKASDRFREATGLYTLREMWLNSKIAMDLVSVIRAVGVRDMQRRVNKIINNSDRTIYVSDIRRVFPWSVMSKYITKYWKKVNTNV